MPIYQYQPQYVLTNYCYIPHTCRQFAQESKANQVKTVILQQRWQVCFHKQADKMNYRACIGCRSGNKSIIINQIN